MPISFKRIKEVLKPEAYKNFEKFMYGQTYVDEGVFEDDFIRWIKKLPVID